MRDPLLTPVRQVWRYWVALLIPPVAWGARLVIAWVIAELACPGPLSGEEAPGIGLGYYVVQTALILIAAGTTAWSGLVAWRLWRHHGTDAEVPEAPDFLALSGVLAAVTFFILIVAEGSAVYVVGCE